MTQQLTDTNKNCLNCGAAIQENFCTYCGQPTGTGRISFKETISNFFAIAFALEGPLMLTIRLLIVNPGKLYREYIAGKRKTYYKPVAFFILVTALYLILRAWIGFDPLEGESVNNDMDELAELAPGLTEVFRLMSENINNILFLLVFSIALMLKLFFRKNYNLAEYTSIGLFIAGMFTLVKILTMVISKLAALEVDNIELAILLLLVFYNTFSLFQKKDLLSLVRYVLVSVFSLVLYLFFALGLFVLIVLLK